MSVFNNHDAPAPRKHSPTRGRTYARRVTLCGVLVAAGFFLSYLEAILPFSVGIPGVKLGLCHIITVLALERLSTTETVCITAVRVVLAALLFGSVASLLYSGVGAALSLLVMLTLRAFNRRRENGSMSPILGPVGLSVCGGVAHNLGQLGTAALLMSTPGLLWYLPVLLVAGCAFGSVTGVVGGLVADRLPRSILPR